eukprot:3033689-Prymnesium_polylepis.1
MCAVGLSSMLVTQTGAVSRSDGFRTCCSCFAPRSTSVAVAVPRASVLGAWDCVPFVCVYF